MHGIEILLKLALIGSIFSGNAHASFPPPKEPAQLSRFIRDPKSAAQLGKALFWDAQAGSDGRVACATCHHQAFSDSRVAHQLSPGPNGVFESGHLDEKLAAGRFPFKTDDVFGSQGVIKARFKDIVLGQAEEDFEPIPDPIFSRDGRNLRQVTAMNSPTVILSTFNHRNFWDGRAQTTFNGSTPFGESDPHAEGKIWQASASGVAPVSVSIGDSSAASQAVGPALNEVEMTYQGRTWPKIAKKLFHLLPLARQEVHPTDSLLGEWSRSPKPGLDADYRALVEKTFHPRWWKSDAKFLLRKSGHPVPIQPSTALRYNPTEVYDLMEINFSLFWGLAIQAYEATLVSDRTPFDRFREGVRLRQFTAKVERGMNLFNGKAQCNSCHRETLLSAATHENIDKLGVSIKRFQADNREAFLDTGFFNIGVRPTRENLGIGGLTPFGTPLSSTRTLRAGERMAIDGAFKAPGLRNVALTGPYMHNGGLLTLDQVLDFYQTKGDFFSQNFKDININLVNVDFDDEEQDDLEEFLRVGLTDPRVLDEKAPFDHPELEIPHGTGRRRSELYELVPSVGAKGRKAQGLPPIELPMGLPLPGSRD